MQGSAPGHTVSVKRADLQRCGGAAQRDGVESLVERSFEFLLERESPAAILPTFDLSVIQQHFPEYDAAFRR
ncbi:MAG: hypothetical protein PVS2B1_26060 [Candidatus Dormibacteraceae bacterium]